MVAEGVSSIAGPKSIPFSNLLLVCCALPLEALLGYPDRLFRAIGHPVTWIGALIGWLDRVSPRRRWAGVAAVGVLIAATVGPALLVQRLVLQALPGWVALPILALAASALLAQRSLWTHVVDVADALDAQGLDGGRRAVSRIVGRNPDTLDQAGVARAAIESLAENFSDGVVAPALWCAAFGLPGIVFYKAVNTADSMIGHRTPRHEKFGWAAARLDDLINLPASRLAALWLMASATILRADPVGALRAMVRDARKHRSPNAGWPEAAMAGALGLRLAGPRVYGTTRVEDSWMGDGRAEAGPDDIRRALGLYRAACIVQGAAAIVLAVSVRG